MAAHKPRRRGPAEAQARKDVMVSVRLDVGTNARLSAAAALAGLDKSAFCGRAIRAALAGIVVSDRRGWGGETEIVDIAPERAGEG